MPTIPKQNELEDALASWGPLALDSELLRRFSVDFGSDAVIPPWALECNTFGVAVELEGRQNSGASYSVVAAVGGSRAEQANKTAIIPVVGPITPFPVPKIYEIFGIRVAALPNIVASARAAANDPDVNRIILAIHSPGGSAFGVQEAAAALREVASRKPMVASVNYLAASAGYWLASAASEIVATNHALVGSVGARIRHMDFSRAMDREGVTVTDISQPSSKVDVSEYKPLSDSARAQLDGIVGEIYQAFKSDISSSRRIDMDVYGEQYGRVVPTSGALKLGMIDRVATFDQLLNEASQGRDFTSTRRARLAILERECSNA